MSDIRNCFKYQCKECGIKTFQIEVAREINLPLCNQLCSGCYEEKVDKIVKGM